MSEQHGPRLITAPDMDSLLNHAQNIANEYTPGQIGKASTRIDKWGTRIEKGIPVFWAAITIIVED